MKKIVGILFVVAGFLSTLAHADLQIPVAESIMSKTTLAAYRCEVQGKCKQTLKDRDLYPGGVIVVQAILLRACRDTKFTVPKMTQNAACKLLRESTQYLYPLVNNLINNQSFEDVRPLQAHDSSILYFQDPSRNRFGWFTQKAYECQETENCEAEISTSSLPVEAKIALVGAIYDKCYHTHPIKSISHCKIILKHGGLLGDDIVNSARILIGGAVEFATSACLHGNDEDQWKFKACEIVLQEGVSGEVKNEALRFFQDACLNQYDYEEEENACRTLLKNAPDPSEAFTTAHQVTASLCRGGLTNACTDGHHTRVRSKKSR